MAQSNTPKKSKYYITLDAARTGEIKTENGGFIQVIRSSSANATIYVATDENFDSEYLEMRRGDAQNIGRGFDRFYIKNTAQAGEWVELLITGSKEDFSMEISPRGEVNSIAEPVVVKGGNTLAIDQATITSAAAAVEVIAAASTTTDWVIKNHPDAVGTLYIGIDDTVDNTDGFPLLPGESLSIAVSAAVYAYADGGDADCRVIQGSKV